MPLARPPRPVLPLTERRLELGEWVGRGGRTEVRRGLLDAGWGVRRPVLIKLFEATPSDDAELFLDALAAAAARVALVQHPNVAQVYECGEEAGRAFLVTEEVPGVSLHGLLQTLDERGSRLGFDVALFVACEVADALAGALAAPVAASYGRRGVLHGDLSARQVMLGWTGVVKVTDFAIGGVAMGQSGVRSLRMEASRLENLAPELVAGDRTSARSDVFALGMLLRRLFVGPRFPAGVPHAEALRMVREGEVCSPSFRARIPRELAELILTATAVSPEERHTSARSLATELRGIAFRHGVGDARPFLARALDQAFPADFAAADDDDTDDTDDDTDDTDDQDQDAHAGWSPEDEHPDHLETDDLAEAPASGEYAHEGYDSAPRLADAHDEERGHDAGIVDHHPDPWRPAAEEDDDAAPPADPEDEQHDLASGWPGDAPWPDDDLAKTSLRHAAWSDDDLAKTTARGSRAARPKAPSRAVPRGAVEHDAGEQDPRDFDPEATVNLRG